MKYKMKHALQTCAIISALSFSSANVAAEEAFDLNELIAAARTEAPITVYAVTGKIVETAKAFTAKYGVKAVGKKVNEATQSEFMIRESQAGNVVGDLAIAGDIAVVVGQLIPTGIANTWLPPDLAADILPSAQNPLIVVSDAHVWSYNTEVHNSCPVSNVWELTELKWRGKIAMMDPLAKPGYADWFNQLETHHDAKMAKAYQDYFGKPLDVSKKSATATWVEAYATNAPLMADSSGVADAVGGLGQTEPFFGIMSTAKFRGNTKGKTALGICKDVAPFSGWLYPGVAAIATGSDSPNAARLFVHYMLSEEGIAPMRADGKISSNTSLPIVQKEASGVAAHLDTLMIYDTSTAISDLDRRQDWQDLWRSNYSR